MPELDAYCLEAGVVDAREFGHLHVVGVDGAACVVAQVVGGFWVHNALVLFVSFAFSSFRSDMRQGDPGLLVQSVQFEWVVPR